MTVEELVHLREAKDKIEFKEAKHNYPFAGGSHREQADRRKCFFMSFLKVCWLLALVVSLSSGLSAQDTTKTLRLPEVGWTLQIPPGTRLKSSQVDSLIDASKKKMAPAALETKGMQVLFAFFDPPYNALASAISPYDTLHFTWQAYHDTAKARLMQLFARMQPKLFVVDTATGVEVIGGRTFQRLYLETNYPENQVKLYTYWFACRYGPYDLGINISFSEKAVGQQYLAILRNSVFDQ